MTSPIICGQFASLSRFMMTDNPTDSGFAAPPVLTVSALNQAVARLLERSFPLTWIAGEISNFTRASSGHWYFTLKDDAAQVRAVMFRGRAQYADFLPREGDKVEWGGWRFEIVDMDGRKIDKLLVSRAK